jgi:hypothetical protein
VVSLSRGVSGRTSRLKAGDESLLLAAELHPKSKGAVMKRTIRLFGLVLLATALSAGTTFAGGNGAQKTTLLNTTSYSCGSGANPAPESASFAVLNAHDNTLSAEVVLRKALPNATYTVWVIQTPSGADCGTPNLTITTNGQGNGTGHWDEPIIPGSTGAWVAAFASFAPGGYLYGTNAVLG